MKTQQRKIYRKLKDYIYKGEREQCSIFGTFTSADCEFVYEKDGKWKNFFGGSCFRDEHDFLLEYYVVGIHPCYKIVNNKIIPYLSVTLYQNIEVLL